MNLKELIKEKVEKEMPFLRKIKIEQCSSVKPGFITTHLLPYLFYVNTIDEKYRILPIFLRRTEDIIQLPLFYSLGVFKTYADNFLSLRQYESRDFSNTLINILDLSGSVGRLESINYTSKELVIRSGLGNRQVIDFDSIDLLELQSKNIPTAYYRNVKFLFDEVDDYNSAINISENPLELISKMKDDVFQKKNKFNGALFFTHNPSLLKSDDFKDFSINRSSFLNVIPTSRLDSTGGDVRYKRLADSRSKQGKVINELREFIVFSRFENYKAFFMVKEEKDWLNSIVFDFTKDIRDLESVLKVIKEEYVPHMNKEEIRDIYLIFNEKDLFSYNNIIKSNITSTPFILDKKQKQHFLKEYTFTNEINSHCVNDIDFQKDFSVLIKAMKEFCTEIHLIDLFSTLISPVYELRNRINSFYDIESIKYQIDTIKDELNRIKENYLFDKRYNEKFETCNKILNKLGSRLRNHKLNLIKSQLLDNKNSSLCIISFNVNNKDRDYFISEIPNPKTDFFNPKDIGNPISLLETYNKVFILNSNRALSIPIILNSLNSEISLVFNESENRQFDSIRKAELIKNLCNDGRLYEVLNIDKPDDCFKSLDNSDSGIIVDDLPYESDLDEFITSVISDNKQNRIYTQYSVNRTAESLLLVFKDGSSIAVAESKYFFIHKENIKSLNDCHVQAKDLKPEDLVFILSHDADEFERMIWDIADEYQDIQELLSLDVSWRSDIDNYITHNKIAGNDFIDLLNENGYIIYSFQTVKNWVNGYVYQPQNIDLLMSVLAELNIVDQNKVNEIVNSIKVVKALKTRLPYELRKHHIAELNDLEYNSNFVFPELIERMYQFIDIKTVNLIIK